jgi:hypothetical protein
VHAYTILYNMFVVNLILALLHVYIFQHTKMLLAAFPSEFSWVPYAENGSDARELLTNGSSAEFVGK